MAEICQQINVHPAGDLASSEVGLEVFIVIVIITMLTFITLIVHFVLSALCGKLRQAVTSCFVWVSTSVTLFYD